MAAGYASFEALVGQLMSADNAARSAAEKAFGAQADAQPDALVTELLNIVSNGAADLGNRSECAILMRRVSEAISRRPPPPPPAAPLARNSGIHHPKPPLSPVLSIWPGTIAPILHRTPQPTPPPPPSPTPLFPLFPPPLSAHLNQGVGCEATGS